MVARFDYSHQVDRLEAACKWGALSRGRATRYAKLIRELFTGRPRTREHVYACNESFEITDIHQLWELHTDRFPGIKTKICAALNSGSVVTDDERHEASSNRPRNDAFPFLLGGKLLAVGVEVLAVDGVLASGQETQWSGDITIRHEKRILDIQCKRPFTNKTIVKLAQEGAKQITDAVQPGVGIIALDLSRTIRPQGKILATRSEDNILNYVDKLLRSTVPPGIVETIKDPKILGLIVFGRVPVMLEEANGYVPLSANMTLVVASSHDSHRTPLLEQLTVQLNKHLSV